MYQPDILTKEEGGELLKIARRAMESFVRNEHAPGSGDYPEKFRQLYGIFCELLKNNETRGSAVSGLPYPLLPIIDATITSVIASSHEDKRFPAITPDELGEIKIELSILTEPKYITVKNNLDYLHHIIPGTDGIVFRYGPYESFLPPQTWEKVKEKELFLEQLCLRAGASKESWKEPGAELYTFQAQVFREE